MKVLKEDFTYSKSDIDNNLDDIYFHLDEIGPDISGVEIALEELKYKYPKLSRLRFIIDDAMSELADVRKELDDYFNPEEEDMEDV